MLSYRMRYLLFFLCFCIHAPSMAQPDDSRVLIYSTLPPALFFKIRLKAEYDFDKHNAVQLMYSRHWNGFYGDMAGAEYRRYSALGTHYKWFGYGKAGWGNFTYRDNNEDSHISLYLGTITYAGAGLGIQFNYNMFYFDLGAGFKAVTLPSQQSKNANSGAFFEDFRTGLNPGTPFDVNLMIGWTLWSHKRKSSNNEGTATTGSPQ